MSAYSAPERNTGTFISAYHPKKIFSTDHTHSGFGDGDDTVVIIIIILVILIIVITMRPAT